MTSSVATQITALRNETAYANSQKERTTGMQNDSNTFLTLMLKPLENQDPTNPTDNTEWLSQLAQYSSLEQMTQMNTGLTNCASYISSMYDDMMMNSEISQTLSMIGKDVTLKIPNETDSSKTDIVTGKVTEATFDEGCGKVKIGDKLYPISYIVSVKDGTIQQQ